MVGAAARALRLTRTWPAPGPRHNPGLAQHAVLAAMPTPCPTAVPLHASNTQASLSLFWRTFMLLALLLGGGIFAWVLALQKLESEPRVALAAQQIASLVNLSREGLRYTDPINRVTLVKAMSTSEAIRLTPREPTDTWQPFEQDSFTQRVGNDLRARLGPDTIAARSVNGVAGLWVGFSIEKDPWWLRADTARIHPLRGSTWFVWMGIALLATVIGSIAIARLINRPLRDLALAAQRVGGGEFGVRLDERTRTQEIRAVNTGFNRMARGLAQAQTDRAVMLAGISHDLRAPLTRLSLEAELGVPDATVRSNMAGDIAQLDAIIGKFMDYAKPGSAVLRPVALAPLVGQVAAAVRQPDAIHINVDLPTNLHVLADPVELGRVFANLFENALRYARVPAGDEGGEGGEGGIATVHVSSSRSGPWVVCSVRDHGPGVAVDALANLTTPFFRADAAGAASGTGLGLAIVETGMQRMGGSVQVANAPGGGLLVELQLQQAAQHTQHTT